MSSIQLKISILICLIAFVACEGPDMMSEPIDKSEIPGMYQANFAGKHDYIELRKDSTFIHYMKIDNKEYADTGHWGARKDYTGQWVIGFDGFFNRRSDSWMKNADTTKPEWGAYLKKFGRNMYIQYDPGHHYHYYKVE